MKLDVRFFALYRERAKCSHCSFHVPEGATVADLIAEVRRRFPTLAPAEVKIRVAVDTEFAAPELVLHERNEVCLIPPVSGG
jgi:molybdopterin converting factor subunit 1